MTWLQQLDYCGKARNCKGASGKNFSDFSTSIQRYIACDTYEENSIKRGERAARGTSERYFLRSPDMKVPHHIAGFLRNDSNKEMLFDLIQQSIEDDRANQEDRTVYFSNKKICTMIKEDQVTVLPNLNSDHEEADTKLVALVCAANVPSEESIMVRSPSGNIDILTVCRT